MREQVEVIEVEQDPKDGAFKPKREQREQRVRRVWVWPEIDVSDLLHLVFLFYVFALNHTGKNEIGIAHSLLSGKSWYQAENKWYVTHPLVFVGYVDLAPMRVSIPSDSNIEVSKLVRFRPEAWEEFDRRQGFCWFWCDQHDIMLGWAFSGEKLGFLEIIEPVKKE